MADGWLSAWRERAGGDGEDERRHDTSLHQWVVEIFEALGEALATGTYGPIASAPEAVPVWRALEAIAHLRRWLPARCQKVGLALSDSERMLFEDLIDACSIHLARGIEQDAAYRARFVDMLAHDLRTPLASVLFTTEALTRANPSPEDLQRGLGRIERSSRRMHRLVEDLLELARARAGATPKRVPIVISDLCRRIVDEAESAHPHRMLTVSSVGDTRGVWDPARLEQVVQNLVVNAIAYSPPETGVRVLVRGEDDAVQISVNNAGAPIPTEQLIRRFDPFQQPPGNEHGTGLGLHIAQEFVRAHGGRIDVTSSENAGTTFRVELPRRRCVG